MQLPAANRVPAADRVSTADRMPAADRVPGREAVPASRLERQYFVCKLISVYEVLVCSNSSMSRVPEMPFAKKNAPLPEGVPKHVSEVRQHLSLPR